MNERLLPIAHKTYEMGADACTGYRVFTYCEADCPACAAEAQDAATLKAVESKMALERCDPDVMPYFVEEK